MTINKTTMAIVQNTLNFCNFEINANILGIFFEKNLKNDVLIKFANLNRRILNFGHFQVDIQRNFVNSKEIAFFSTMQTKK